MAITNLYSNLPAHLVEFKDGGLSLKSSSDAVTGKSILITGTSLDGPINEPVAIDVDTVSLLFGPEADENGRANGTTLTKFAKQAYKNGFRDIRCMRVTGTCAEARINKVKESVTETISTSQNLGVINGNDGVVDKTVSTVLTGPIIADSFIVKTTAGQGVGVSNLRPYSKKFNIGANIVSAGASLTATFNYEDIKAVTSEDVTLTSVEGGAFAPYKVKIVEDNSKTTAGIYQTDAGVMRGEGDKDEYGFTYASGIEVKVKTSSSVAVDTVLEEGTDYTVNYTDGTVSVLSTSSLAENDEVTVKYVPYVVASGTDTFTVDGAPQKFNLAQEPISGTFILKVNGTTAVTGYTLNGSIVTVDPSKFSIGDSITCTYSFSKTDETTEGMTVRAIYGGESYNGASVSVTKITDPKTSEEGRLITFTKPDAKKYTKGEAPIAFTSFNYPTIGDLTMALKQASLNNVFEIVSDNEMSTTNDLPLINVTLEGGTSGVNPTNNQMYEALSGTRNAEGYVVTQGAYQILENYNVDYIYPAGVYADSVQTVNPNSSFHDELCLLCAVLSYRTKMTHGLMDVKPNSNTTLVGIQKYVDALVAYDNTHFMKDSNGDVITDENNKAMDLGWYTSLVVGPEPIMVSDKLGTYYGSPAIAYGALNASLPASSAPTNKALIGVKGMRYKLSNKQMNQITGNRMICFKLKNEGSTSTNNSIPYVVDGCTCASEGSDYTRLTTVKVVTEVIDQIREVADPFIGEPNTVEQRNALSALISKRLSYLLEQGVILYYSFEISATNSQVALGECSIALTLVPPQELRKITTVVALKSAA